MSSNISNPFPKKSNNTSRTVRKTCGDLDGTKKALVTDTNPVVKEVKTDMGKKNNVVKESITPPIEKKWTHSTK